MARVPREFVPSQQTVVPDQMDFSAAWRLLTLSRSAGSDQQLDYARTQLVDYLPRAYYVQCVFIGRLIVAFAYVTEIQLGRYVLPLQLPPRTNDSF